MKDLYALFWGLLCLPHIATLSIFLWTCRALDRQLGMLVFPEAYLYLMTYIAGVMGDGFGSLLREMLYVVEYFGNVIKYDTRHSVISVNSNGPLILL